jgi:hypothetical protein
MFAPMAGGGKQSVGAVSTQSNNSNANANKKGGGKKWNNNKKDGKQAHKAGKPRASVANQHYF